MARRQSISGALAVVEKYICANVRAKGLAGPVGEHTNTFFQCAYTRFYDAHLDNCCLSALAVMADSANFCVVHVF